MIPIFTEFAKLRREFAQVHRVIHLTSSLATTVSVKAFISVLFIFDPDPVDIFLHV